MLTDDIEEPSSFVMARPYLWRSLLFGPFAIALLCYFWAFCSQSHKLPDFRGFNVLSCKCGSAEVRRSQNTYHAAFSLLLFDGFTVIAGTVWGTLFFDDTKEYSGIVYVIWLGFRFFSVCQHLIVALISVLYVSRPKWGSGLHILSRILNVVPFVLILLNFLYYDGILIGVDIYNFLLMLAIVVSCCLLETSPMAEQRKPFVLLSVSLFLLICLPNAVMNCLIFYSDKYYAHVVDVLLITNVYIVMDALLFYLVLKIKDEGQFGNEYEGAIRSV